VLTEVGGKLIGIFGRTSLAQGCLSPPEGPAAEAEPGLRGSAGARDEPAGFPPPLPRRPPVMTLPIEERADSCPIPPPTKACGAARCVHNSRATLRRQDAAELDAIENFGPASIEDIRPRLGRRGLRRSARPPASANVAEDPPGGVPAPRLRPRTRTPATRPPRRARPGCANRGATAAACKPCPRQPAEELRVRADDGPPSTAQRGRVPRAQGGRFRFAAGWWPSLGGSSRSAAPPPRPFVV